MIPKTRCEYCGEMKYNKGYKAHTTACARKHRGVKMAEPVKTPAFERQPVTSSIRFERHEPPQQGESLAHHTPDPDLTLSEGMAFAYNLFPEDSACFMAVFHLVSMKSDGSDPYRHLRGARDMIDLKLQSLESSE